MLRALRLKLTEWTQEYQQYLESAPTLDVCSCSWTLVDPDAGENSRRVRSHVNLECPVHTREGRVLGFLVWAEKTKGLRFYTLQEQIDAIVAETGESEEIARMMVESHDACRSEEELDEVSEETDVESNVISLMQRGAKLSEQPEGLKLDVSNVDIPPEELERIKEKLKDLPQRTLTLDGVILPPIPKELLEDTPQIDIAAKLIPICPTTLRTVPVGNESVSITGEHQVWRCCGGAYPGEHVTPDPSWLEDSRRNGVYRS